MEKDLEYYLYKRYPVTTHAIALIEHNNIDLVGIPLTEINGEVFENHGEVVETKFTIGKIIRTFKLNIPLSLREKKRIPEYVHDFECLIALLNNRKSRNMLDHKVTLPNFPDISLVDIITFYNTLTYNNKRVVDTEIIKKLEDDFELLPKELRETNRNAYGITKGENFIDTLNGDMKIPNTRLKKNYGGIRDEY